MGYKTWKSRLFLKDIWPIDNVENYKIHFGRKFTDPERKIFEPLDEWVSDRLIWQNWQEHFPGMDDFNREYIYSVINFYHESDAWLFGGIFRVKDRLGDRYEVELEEIGKEFIGRLKLRLQYKDRKTRVKFENHYHKFEVLEILREPYTGRVFPGYDKINIMFTELEAVIRKEKPDWKLALTIMNGVYMITDISSGKHYIGSAYGEGGIWSRWQEYVNSGHGGNKELKKLLDTESLEYARSNLKFTLLENFHAKVEDETVTDREKYWKEVLLTGQFGLNLN